LVLRCVPILFLFSIKNCVKTNQVGPICSRTISKLSNHMASLSEYNVEKNPSPDFERLL
jgi:hypothetical protein